MPNGSKKRPDTLELEVLGSHHNEISDDETVNKEPRTSNTLNNKSSINTDTKLQNEEETVTTTRRRWFQFGRKAHKRSTSADRKRSHNTAPTLAKPEATTIANSTNTITTPLANLPTHQTIPDVAAVLPRSNSKKRRSKTQSESLYSLATLAQTGEIQILQPHSAPNVHNKHDDSSVVWTPPQQIRPNSADNIISVAKAKDAESTLCNLEAQEQKFLNPYGFRDTREQVLLTTEVEAEDEIDDPQFSRKNVATGFFANIMSIFSKLAIWKHSNCCRRRSIAKTNGNGSESIATRKSLNASSDFEQFSATPGGSSVFSTAKEKGIKRLSQIRRRRSSYYFSDNERRIRANDREFNAQFKYADNFIHTSKYSLLTFLPLNLLEQFQRLANFYFLCLLVLQLIPAISSLTPVTTAIPLIGVLTLTAVKDAYDDIQRHLSDSQVNNRKSKLLKHGKLVDAKWSGVQVGDVIRLENNQFVAADILLLTTSEPNGLCFIETAELDGETNLKCKQCLTETVRMGQDVEQLWTFNGEIICERPNNLLNKFDGTLIWRSQRYALDNEKILLRGCVLRNTQWCYGVVVFAGKDTKLMQNSGKTQFKSTGVDRLLNFIIIGIVLFLLSICAFFTVACAIWEGMMGQNFQVYLPWENIIPKDIAQGATVIGLLVFFSYAIVLNTVVPISLYVSVEVIRFVQSFLINWDEDMYYERTKTHAKARTTTLNEELGQIQYIFSDKTGTLTQNIMTFNKCSINGRTYGDVIDMRTGEVIEITDKQNNQETCNKSTSTTFLIHKVDVHPKTDSILVAEDDGVNTTTKTSTTTPITSTPSPNLPISAPSDVVNTANRTFDDSSPSILVTEDNGVNTMTKTSTSTPITSTSSPNLPISAPSDAVNTANRTFEDSSPSSLNSSNADIPTSTKRKKCYFNREESFQSISSGNIPVDTTQKSTRRRTGSESEKAIKSVDFSENPEYEPDFRWYDKTLLDAVRSDEEHAHNFFRLLALCHTVMAEYVDGRLEYQAQSPDEAALVSAARNFGFVFRSRTPNSITIEVMGRSEEYELLNILDFNNVRKRMSVILRRGNNIILYTKGADNVIYDRLSTSQEDIKARTLEHLNKFAGEGLRTLALAERRLDATYYNNWNQRFLDASISLDHREEKLNVMYEEIESELMLVGVTAIEDKLQDGVPHTIANLQVAGIKIWVLTGDKQETAINIGYSCQLLTDELADIFIVDGSSLEEVEKQLRQFKESIRIVNRFRPTPLEPAVNLNLNGAHTARRSPSSPLSPFRAQISPPPAPAISVVTFSAEVSELYDGLEKGSSASAHHLKDDLADDSSGFAIVINGHSLVYCLLPELEEKFLEVALQCKAVICCRVTPLQKALVVELIKRSRNAVTLAIGDGANDVSMIKAAHIGVGISGQEGMQAVLASDYSIAQFRYLERLLLVHGRWSYYRMCKFLRYFFYKNFAFTLCHCWYSFFCGFSAQTVFDPMFISVYNLFYTSLPVLALGIFEQDVSDKHSVDFPKLYTPGLRSQLFNIREFVYSVLHGAFSSLILFLIPYGTYKDGVSPDGTILSDHMTLGAVVATILIIDNTAQIAIYTSYWTIFNHITIWGSLIWYFVLDSFYNYVIGGPYVGSLAMAVKDLTFWATMIITVVVIMAPVLAYKFYLLDVFPSLSDKIRFKRKQASLRSRQSSSVIRTPSSRRARRSLRSGYAFAHQEGFGRLITSGKIMRKLPQEFAFPLGLGSKKSQGATSVSNETTRGNQTSINGESHNSSMASVLHNNAGSGSNTSAKIANSDSISPRAPYQDLDTINL